MTESQTAPAPLSDEARQWRRRIFAATWFSYLGLYFCRKPFYVVKAALEDDLGFDPSKLAWIGSAYLIAYTIGQFVSGYLGNKRGPRILLLAGMGVSVGANLAFGFANTWVLFAAFMVLNGLAQSTGWSNNVGTMARWFRRRERGTVMGFWATNYQVGGIAANALAAWALGAYGFRYSFFAGSCVLLLVWVFFFFNQANDPEDVGLAPIDDPDEVETTVTNESGETKSSWTRQVWTNVLLVGTFYFFIKFIRYALWSWAPYLLNKYYGLELDDAGYVSTIFDVAGFVGVVTAGFLSDRVFAGRRARISFFFVLGMAASCTFLYVAGSTSIVVFAIAIGLIGFFLYGPDALMTGAGAIDVGSRKQATLAAGIINGMGSVGSVMQEFVLGSVLKGGDVGLVFAFLLAAAIGAAAMLSVVLLRNRKGQADL